MHWIGGIWFPDLCLYYYQRNTVHEKHDVRNDGALDATRRIYPELVDGMELVTVWMPEVDELDNGVRFLRYLVSIYLSF